MMFFQLQAIPKRAITEIKEIWSHMMTCLIEFFINSNKLFLSSTVVYGVVN